MWNDYFGKIRNKYGLDVSSKNPLIFNLDGKDVTKDLTLNLLSYTSDNDFLKIMEKTVKYFTTKYSCMAIFGSDEVCFIFENPTVIINDLNSSGFKKGDMLISLFSQYFYDYFNELNHGRKIFWHAKCFSIPKGKMQSFIKYKCVRFRNVITTYLLKKNNVKDAGRIKLDEKIKLCEQIDGYDKIKQYENGILYYCGKQIDIEEYLKGNIKYLKMIEYNDIDFFDLAKWSEMEEGEDE